MNICFTTIGLNFGGAERVTSILANKLTEYGHKVTIIILNEDHTIAYSIHENVNILYMQSACFNKFGNLSKLIIKLRQLLKSVNPDVVLSFSNTTFTFTWLATMGMKIPLIFSERNDPNVIKGMKDKAFQNIALKMAKKIVFQTNGAKNYYTKNKIQKKSVVILNPFSTNNIDNISECVVRKKEIVSVGRLTQQKNQKLLINAFIKIANLVPDYNLVIYGEGNLRSELEEMISSNKMENRIFLPGTKKDVLTRINSAALFVLTSDYEGLPNALIEAMALGLPCISTDCSPGGARELIKDHINGIVVPVNDEEQLIESIRYMLDNSNEAKKMGQEAKAIINLLDENIVAKQWEKVIISSLTQ